MGAPLDRHYAVLRRAHHSWGSPPRLPCKGDICTLLYCIVGRIWLLTAPLGFSLTPWVFSQQSQAEPVSIRSLDPVHPLPIRGIATHANAESFGRDKRKFFDSK